MVDFNDLQRATQLMNEDRVIAAALAAVDADDTKIVNMTVSGPNTVPPNAMVLIDASYMDPPPQMLDTIKHLMQDRQDAVRDELRALGISGVDAVARSEKGART